MNEFQSLIANAAELPFDQTDSAVLPGRGLDPAPATAPGASTTRTLPTPSKRSGLRGRLGEVPLAVADVRAAVDDRRSARTARGSAGRPSSRRAASCGRRRRSALVNFWPQAVRLPKKPGPYQLASSSGHRRRRAHRRSRRPTTPSARMPAVALEALDCALGGGVELVGEAGPAVALGPQDPVERGDVAAAVAELKRALAELRVRAARGEPSPACSPLDRRRRCRTCRRRRPAPRRRRRRAPRARACTMASGPRAVAPMPSSVPLGGPDGGFNPASLA